MSNRDNFQWRPNDNSSTTLLRYDLEAKHWTKAFKSASMKHQPVNYGKDLIFIGVFLSIFINFISLLLLGIIELIQRIRGEKKTYKPQSITETHSHLVNKPLTEEEIEGIRKTWKYNLENDGFKTIEYYEKK
jgi:hypothetical protein